MRDLFGGKSSFTLPELIISISILSILSLITIASYHHIVFRAKIAQLHSKCHVLSQRYIEFYTTNQRYPEDLVFIPPPTWGDGSIEWTSAFNAYNFFYFSLSKDLGQIFSLILFQIDTRTDTSLSLPQKKNSTINFYSVGAIKKDA